MVRKLSLAVFLEKYFDFYIQGGILPAYVYKEMKHTQSKKICCFLQSCLYCFSKERLQHSDGKYIIF